MPTISGFRRRGYTPQAVRAFCKHIGVNKFNSTVDIGLLENFLREDLNKRSARVMGVLRPLKLIIDNYPEGQVEELEAVNNPEDPSAGARKVPFSRVLYIEQDDFRESPPPKYFRLFPGNEVRLRYAYFVKCTHVTKDAAGNITEVHCTYDQATKGGDSPDGRKVFSGSVDKTVRVWDVESRRTTARADLAAEVRAVAWMAAEDGFSSSYCNTIPTPEGGTHESGLRVALLRGLREHAERIGQAKRMGPQPRFAPRIAGPLEGPNQLAGYFDVSLPLLFAFAVETSDVAVHAALALAIFADLLTFSRGGALGAIAGLVTVATVYGRSAVSAISAIVSGLFGGVIILSVWGFALHSFLLLRPWSFTDTSYAGGVGSRSELWYAAWRLWRERPWLGVGAGNFQLELPRAGLHGIRTHANSLYLQSLVEGGLPLFAATLWLLYNAIAPFWGARATRNAFVAGALGASVALALHQIVDFLSFYPKVGGWWWIALALGAAVIAGRRENPVDAGKNAPCV